MITINSTGIITVCKGDTFMLTAVINNGTLLVPDYYTLQGTDQVILSITSPNKSFDNYLVKKIGTVDNLNTELGHEHEIIFTFASLDTKVLPTGNYYYEIKAYLTVNGEAVVNTIVPRTKFILIE